MSAAALNAIELVSVGCDGTAPYVADTLSPMPILLNSFWLEPSRFIGSKYLPAMRKAVGFVVGAAVAVTRAIGGCSGSLAMRFDRNSMMPFDFADCVPEIPNSNADFGFVCCCK